MFQPLRLAYISIVIAVHEASDAASSSCGLGPVVVAAVPRRLVGGERVLAHLDVVGELLALARDGAHRARVAAAIQESHQSSGLNTMPVSTFGKK